MSIFESFRSNCPIDRKLVGIQMVANIVVLILRQFQNSYNNIFRCKDMIIPQYNKKPCHKTLQRGKMR